MRFVVGLPLIVLAFAVVGIASACSSTVVQITCQGSCGDGGVASDSGVTDEEEGRGDASSSKDGATDAPPSSAGDGVNPYGVAYPSKSKFGLKARVGSTPGKVFPDLVFDPGTKAGAATTLTKIGLADLFDPEGRTHDMVAVFAVNQWDVYSKALMDKLNGALPIPTRVVILSVLGDGVSPGAAATDANFLTWRTTYPWAWHGRMAPGFAELGAPQASPLLFLIDARTMEITYTDVGMPQEPKTFLGEERDKITARPPSSL